MSQEARTRHQSSEPSAAANTRASISITTPSFDGIICFGGVDWWYHNRGHYDVQMMRELSKRVPVLYVNSIGMRTPRPTEGRMFGHRIKRKIKSIARGLTAVSPNFSVFSPVSFPGNALASKFASWMLAAQTRWAARRSGIRQPLIWVACPPAALVLSYFGDSTVVYQRTDRFEEFAGVDREFIKQMDQRLKERATTVLFCASKLLESELADCVHAEKVDHGVDFDKFASAGTVRDRFDSAPGDVSRIRRPVVGFIGGIDEHTFNPELFNGVAKKLPDVSFLLVGACSLPEGWCTLSNVHLVGQRPYDTIAEYMAASDVLIMPWNQNEWIRYCNPVKLKEYLAVGRPIVSTSFPELCFYEEHVSIADTAEDFANAVRAALREPNNADAQRDRVRAHTWSNKADAVWKLLTDGSFREA